MLATRSRAVSTLSAAKDVVVHVLVVRRERLVNQVSVLPEQPADELAHRDDDTAQLGQALAQLEPAAPDRQPGPRVEQRILELVNRGVELLDGAVVPVDDGVEQSVHQEADGAGGGLGAGVPPGEQRVDVEVGLAHRNQGSFGDERADLAGRQLT